MDGGGDDPFIQQVLEEIQQKIASETARRNEKLENERAEIERRISKRNVDIDANLDMIQTCLSTIREAEEANAALKRENAVDKQRKDEIITIIETAAKEKEKQLLSNLKSKLSPASRQVTPELKIAEISRPQQKAAVALNGATRMRESRTDSERPVHDPDQQQPTVRRSGRATKPVEHLLDTYFSDDREPQIKVSESPTQPLLTKEEKVQKTKKRSPAEQDDHQSPVPSRKRSKRESSTIQLETPKQEPEPEISKPEKPEPVKKVRESKSHIPLPVIAQIPNPRPKKDTAVSTKPDKATPSSKNTPKSDVEDEDRAPPTQKVPDPVVGQVYQIEWCRKPWTAVVLPTGDLGEVGMSGTLSDTGFAPPWPGCYRRFKPRGEEPYMGFKFDYRDGNSRSHLKKYPIMYLEENMVVPINPAHKFEPPKFNPGKYAAYAWVRADELKPFDLDDPESRKLKGFATTRSFIRRLDKIRDIKAETRVTTSTGREGVPGLADIIINDNEDDSDYYEESSGHSDNDEPDGGPAEADDSSDEEPQTSTSRAKRARNRAPSTQSRRSKSGSKSNARGSKAGSRRTSEAAQWSGQHAQSQFKPVSDVEDSDSDLTSVSADTVSHDRASSPELGEGAINDTMTGRPETGDSGQPRSRSLQEETQDTGGNDSKRGDLEGSPDLGLEANEPKIPAVSGTDALDGLATAAVVLAAQNNATSSGSVNRPFVTQQPGPHSFLSRGDETQRTNGGVPPSSRSMTPHTRQSSRSDYQSAPASPLLALDGQTQRYPPGSQQAPTSKMRLENFLRPGPPTPVDRSNSNSPTKSIAEYYQKTHDFGAPIGRRPGPLSVTGPNKTMTGDPNAHGFGDPRDPRTIVAASPTFRESLNGYSGGGFGNQSPTEHERVNGTFRGPASGARNDGRTGAVNAQPPPPPSPRNSSSFVNRMVN